MFLTLDGVMEDPGGGEGFQHGGWQLPFFDPDMATGIREGLFTAGALLLGRVTYEQSAAAWASMTDEEGFAERMNTMPKYVASTTLREPLAWNATLLDGDVPAAVAKLKQQPGGDLLVQGSGTLVRTLMQRNLIDAYQLWVHPVVLGSGRRLFADGVAPTSLQLVTQDNQRGGCRPDLPDGGNRHGGMSGRPSGVTNEADGTRHRRLRWHRAATGPTVRR